MLDSLFKASLAKLDEYSPKELTSALQALAKLEYRDDAVLARLCKASVTKLDGYSHKKFTRTLQVLAKLESQEKHGGKQGFTEGASRPHDWVLNLN